MRLAIALLLLAAPANAWEFSSTPICTLSHETQESSVVVTYDPATLQYELTLELNDSVWPNAPTFGMLFDGPRRIQIGTDRHQLSADRRVLSVADSGFGNVLDGLEFNDRAFARSGALIVDFSLESATDHVRAFRDCGGALTS